MSQTSGIPACRFHICQSNENQHLRLVSDTAALTKQVRLDCIFDITSKNLKTGPKSRQRIQGIVCFFAIFHVYLSILQYIRSTAQTRKAGLPKVHLTTWSDA